MKTVKEAAKEHGRKVSPQSDWTARNAEISFKSGVEFAQRWIPVEEEPEDQQKILLKYKDTELSAVYHRAVKIVQIQSFGNLERQHISFNIFESWRPIELE